MNNKPKKISFIFWDGWLNVSPTLVSLLEYLSEKGHYIDFYIRDEDNYDLSIINDFKNVNFIRINTNRKSLYNKIINKLISVLSLNKNRTNFIFKAINDILSYNKVNVFSQLVNKNISYDVCFCIDSIGLYIHKKSNIKSIKTINLSLEINDYKKNTFFLRQLKENEIKYLSYVVDYTLIQDLSRWEVLKKITKYSRNNYLLLPNSCRLENTDKKDEFFFNRKFNISNNHSIILSAGMINEEVLSLDTAKVIGNSNTKNKIKIIFHNRIKSSVDKNNYLKEILKHGKDKVILSLSPVEYSELYKIFTSAKIGLVFYDKNNPDQNFSTIGAASGKLFQYIKYGLPIITTDNDGLTELVNQYNLGVVIKDLSELPNAIDLILDNYEHYSNEVKKAFQEKLNIDIYLDKIYSLIIE